MLLIMIKLKEVYPDMIASIMKSEIPLLQNPSLMPRERELLLRLLISYLPPLTVLAEIRNSSPMASASIIRNLCHLPLHVLLDEYVRIENGLLDFDNPLVVESIVDLILEVSQQSTHFERIQIIQALFKRLVQNKGNNESILRCICTLLQNTYYIVSEGEMDALLLLAREESTCALAVDSFHRCVLPSMNEVKKVKEECVSIDAKKCYLLKRVMRRLKWIGLTLLDSEA